MSDRGRLNKRPGHMVVSWSRPGHIVAALDRTRRLLVARRRHHAVRRRLAIVVVVAARATLGMDFDLFLAIFRAARKGFVERRGELWGRALGVHALEQGLNAS